MNIGAKIAPARRARIADIGALVPTGDFKRAGGFTGIRTLIAKHGGDPAAVLDQFGIDTRLFDDSEAYVSYPRMVKVLEHCASTFGEPFFGFELGKGQTTDVMGPLAALMLSSATVAEGLQLVERFMAVHAPGARMQLSQTGRETRLSYEVLDRASTACRQVNELSMTAAFNIMRALAGADFEAEGVEIASAPPTASRERLERYFSAPIHYEQPISALCFRSDYLTRRIDTGNPTLLRFAKEQCETLCPDEPQLEQVVASHIRRLMPMGACSLEMVARQLSIHPRSLQNRLTAEGLEFREILKDQRKELASAYLAGSRTPLAEVASLLGYADQASFSRAFTSWYGTSPRRFRNASAQ